MELRIKLTMLSLICWHICTAIIGTLCFVTQYQIYAWRICMIKYQNREYFSEWAIWKNETHKSTSGTYGRKSLHGILLFWWWHNPYSGQFFVKETLQPFIEAGRTPRGYPYTLMNPAHIAAVEAATQEFINPACIHSPPIPILAFITAVRGTIAA